MRLNCEHISMIQCQLFLKGLSNSILILLYYCQTLTHFDSTPVGYLIPIIHIMVANFRSVCFVSLCVLLLLRQFEVFSTKLSTILDTHAHSEREDCV